MYDMIFFGKHVLILEEILILAFVVLTYGAKGYYELKTKRERIKNAKMRDILSTATKQKTLLTQPQINYLQPFDHSLLFLIHELDSTDNTPQWKEIRNQVIQQVVQPTARKLAKSSKSLKRYLATECFSFGTEPSDQNTIISLLQDPTLLISLNAARVAFKYPSPELINAVIDRFSREDRFQQSAYANMLAENSKQIAYIIEQRLLKEKNTQIKIFCYRLMTVFPPQKEMMAAAQHDITNEDLDLKLAVLTYLAHHKQSESITILRNFLTDKQWEVRSRAIQLLGDLKDIPSLPVIRNGLHDSDWWVRFRAAEALCKLGEQGIAILQAQDHTTDPYAYDVANQALISYRQQGEK